MILYVARGSSSILDAQEIRLDAGTIELEMPAGLNILGGDIPNHVHHFARHDPVAVWVQKPACRWCKAGY